MDALKVCDEMLHSPPLSCVIPFNQIFTQLIAIAPDHQTAILIHGFVLHNGCGYTNFHQNAADRSLRASCVHCQYTYKGLLQGLKLVASGEKLGGLLEYGIFPNVVTFNILVDAIYKDSLMHGYCLRGEMDKARHLKTSQEIMRGDCRKDEKLFSEMLGCGQLPNIHTNYAVILDGLCNNQLSA
ncbi:hypothetical protein ACLB2K_004323 [Fragaria x ananassa]